MTKCRHVRRSEYVAHMEKGKKNAYITSKHLSFTLYTYYAITVSSLKSNVRLVFTGDNCVVCQVGIKFLYKT